MKIEIRAIDFYKLSESEQNDFFILSRENDVELIDENQIAHTLIDLINIELVETESE